MKKALAILAAITFMVSGPCFADGTTKRSLTNFCGSYGMRTEQFKTLLDDPVVISFATYSPYSDGTYTHVDCGNIQLTINPDTFTVGEATVFFANIQDPDDKIDGREIIIASMIAALELSTDESGDDAFTKAFEIYSDEILPGMTGRATELIKNGGPILLYSGNYDYSLVLGKPIRGKASNYIYLSATARIF